METRPSPNKKEERQNRRAPGTSAGEKAGCDERLCSEKTDFSPATGDPIACRSAGSECNGFQGSAIAPLRLCVFAWVGGGVALRFSGGRVVLASLASWWFNPGRVGGSVSSVPLWFFVRRTAGIVE